MIRFIAALDSKDGIANDHGISWQGKLPSDIKFFRDKTTHKTVLMGYATYVEFAKPLPNRRNCVATSKQEALRAGFKPISDARQFLGQAEEDIWVIGGAGLFASTLDLADELYLTRVDGDFDCTKFFPNFENDFILSEESQPQTENGIIFRFQIWQHKQKQFSKT